MKSQDIEFKYKATSLDDMENRRKEFFEYMMALKIKWNGVNLCCATIGNIAYYFGSGVIVVGDGEPEPDRGLDALLALLGRCRAEVKYPPNAYVPPTVAGADKA